MTDLERDLERLFAADARARTVRAVVLAPRRRDTPFAVFALGAATILVAIAVLAFAGPSERAAAPNLVPVSPTPSSSSPSASPSRSPEACMDPLRRQPGDPVVGGSKIPGGAAAIHSVQVSAGGARWPVIFAVGAQPEGGKPLDVAPRATLRGPDGIVPILGYEAGPDEAHTTPTTATLRILPCDSAVLLVRTAVVRSGEYTLTIESVTTAGSSIAVPIFAPLTCTTTGSTTQCVNTRGTRATPVPSPTSSSGPS